MITWNMDPGDPGRGDGLGGTKTALATLPPEGHFTYLSGHRASICIYIKVSVLVRPGVEIVLQFLVF